MIISYRFFVRMRNILDRNSRQNQNTHFMFNKTLQRIMWYSKIGHRSQYNTAHAHCMLDNQGYRQTFRTCNTDCFSTARCLRERASIIFFLFFIFKGPVGLRMHHSLRLIVQPQVFHSALVH